MLENLANQIYRANTPLTLMITALIVGFIIAFNRKRHLEGTLLRVPYFVLVAATFIVLMTAQFIEYYHIRAVLNDVLWVIVVLKFIGTAFAGYVYGALSMARSRDAMGTANFAFLALVPIVNLILLIVPSLNVNSSTQLTRLRLLSSVPGAFVGVVLFTMPFGMVDMIKTSKSAEKPLTPDQVVTYLVKLRGVEFALEVAASEFEGPTDIEGVLRVEKLEAEGRRLTSHVALTSADLTVDPSDYFSETRREMCRDPSMRRLFDAGAIYVELLMRHDGHRIGSQDTGAAECAVLAAHESGAPDTEIAGFAELAN